MNTIVIYFFKPKAPPIQVSSARFFDAINLKFRISYQYSKNFFYIELISTAMIVIKMNNNPIDMISNSVRLKRIMSANMENCTQKKTKWVFRKRTSPIRGNTRGIGILVHRLMILVPIHRSTFAWHLMRD